MEPKTSAPTAAAPEPEGQDVVWFTRILIVVVLLACGVITVAFVKSKQPAKAEKANRERKLAAFQLTERSGRPVTEATLRDKYLIVSFIYTSCSLTCLNVSQHMAELQQLTKDMPDVQLVSITVDPRSDTPEVLSKFARRFTADEHKWLFLTGEKASVYDLLETSFLTRGAPEENPLMPGGFQHAERIALTDRQGRVRFYFNGLHVKTPTSLLTALQELREEKP
jgi:protein SCO1/2